MGDPIITRIEAHQFEWELHDVGLDPAGLIPTYVPGARYKRGGIALRIVSDEGAVGEYVGNGLPRFTEALIGQNALERERIYRDLKLGGWAGMGLVDNALWDLAGKFYGAPVYKLLGGYRTRLPAYASTMNGATEGELSTPESFADFSQRCLEMGYPAFKIHPWPGRSIQSHVQLVHAVGQRVGGSMDLMLDPFCYYQTFGEALKVGRACDEEGYFWWEDPYADGGVSEFGHPKLRELVKTPLLQGEKVRGVELKTNLMLAKATDYIRGDPGPDGITATMKVAHVAEGLGLDIEMHASGPAMRHCMAAVRNSNYYEIVWVHPELTCTHPPIYSEVCYQDSLYSIDSDGCVGVPDGPGMGVEYDWDWIEAHEVGVKVFGA